MNSEPWPGVLDEIAKCHRIQTFLFHEARLMDEHRYDDWLSLWDHEAHYWIPCNADDVDRSRHISLVNESRTGLEDRIARLKGTSNYAQQPPSRTAHVVSNIEIEAAESGGEVTVHSVIHVTSCRKGRTEVAAGRVTHRLIVREVAIRIVSKKVVLVNNDDVFGNLSFLI